MCLWDNYPPHVLSLIRKRINRQIHDTMTNIELQKAHAEIRACNAIADKYGNGVDWEERNFMCAMELYKMFLQEKMVATCDKAAEMAIDAAKKFVDKYIEKY